MSCPAPAIVLQALNAPAAVMSETTMSAAYPNRLRMKHLSETVAAQEEPIAGITVLGAGAGVIVRRPGDAVSRIHIASSIEPPASVVARQANAIPGPEVSSARRYQVAPLVPVPRSCPANIIN